MAHACCRVVDLRCKEVVNCNDGQRIGFVGDVEVEVVTGKVVGLIVPCMGGLGSIFGRGEEYYVPWEAIKCLGEDIILVECARKQPAHNK